MTITQKLQAIEKLLQLVALFDLDIKEINKALNDVIETSLKALGKLL